MQQLSLFESSSIEQKSSSILSSIGKNSFTHPNYSKTHKPTLNTYHSKGQLYYRVSFYDELGKKKHIHVPGGNVHSKLVQFRATKIEAKINRGETIRQIASLIKSYRGKKNHKI